LPLLKNIVDKGKRKRVSKPFIVGEAYLGEAFELTRKTDPT
jgi:hypothetical protein